MQLKFYFLTLCCLILSACTGSNYQRSYIISDGAEQAVIPEHQEGETHLH